MPHREYTQAEERVAAPGCVHRQRRASGGVAGVADFLGHRKKHIRVGQIRHQLAGPGGASAAAVASREEQQLRGIDAVAAEPAPAPAQAAAALVPAHRGPCGAPGPDVCRAAVQRAQVHGDGASRGAPPPQPWIRGVPRFRSASTF